MKRVLTKTSKMPRISALLAGCLAALALLATASAASAASPTYRPTRTDDPAPNGCKKKNCSLREAVIASNANRDSAIVLRPARRYVLTRRGAGEDAAAAGDLDLTSGTTTVRTKKGRRGAKPAVIDGNDIDRIFDGYGWLRLEGVELRDGHARIGPGDNGDGGGIRAPGRLNLKNSRLVSNVAEGDGGAIFTFGGSPFINKSLLKGNAAAGDGGAVSGTPENLGMTNSRAIDNSAGGTGGVASLGGVVASFTRTYLGGNRAAGAGGAIFTGPTSDTGISIDRSTVAGNESGAYGGGLAIGFNNAVSNSTISGNRAASFGGGIGTFARVGVGNSTIADNRAGGDGGGIGDFGGGSTSELNAVTVARNLADSDSAAGGLGGGLYQGSGDMIRVQNTILALNALGVGAVGFDCSNASTGFDSLGHNLIGDVSGCTGFGAVGDLIGGPLKLGKLAKNGGPTKTIALKRGSRAINGADFDPQLRPPLAPFGSLGRLDQRGVKRGKRPDIGAYERVAKK